MESSLSPNLAAGRGPTVRERGNWAIEQSARAVVVRRYAATLAQRVSNK